MKGQELGTASVPPTIPTVDFKYFILAFRLKPGRYSELMATRAQTTMISFFASCIGLLVGLPNKEFFINHDKFVNTNFLLCVVETDFEEKKVVFTAQFNITSDYI
jgi:hypothetical protein